MTFCEDWIANEITARNNYFLSLPPRAKNLGRPVVKLGLREVPEAKKNAGWNRKGKEK